MTCGIYIHIPFCTEKCHYCSFYSLPAGTGRDLLSPFLDRLDDEISDFFSRHHDLRADTVYFGGGTPSILGAADVKSILDRIRCECDLSSDAEISLEVNPMHAVPELLGAYRNAGVNRMILGVQTLDAELHDFIGRNGSPCTEKTIRDFIDTPGVIHCADIIYGIPGEDPLNVARDLEFLAVSGIKHLSCYSLTIETGTLLGKRYCPEDAFESMQAESLLNVRRTLLDLGFHHYEISNYAMPGYESHHNMKYWCFKPYIAFGPSASGFFEGERWRNPVSLDAYLRGALPEHDKRSADDRLVEYFLAAIRRLDGIPLDEFEHLFVKPVPDVVRSRIEKQMAEGYIDKNVSNGETRIALTEKGLLFADRVIYHIVEDFIGTGVR